MMDYGNVKDYIPKEWLLKFFEKSRDDKLIIKNLMVTDKGFCSFDVHNDILVVFQLYGDGNYWKKILIDFAKKIGCKKIKFGTQRNYKGFERKFGCKLVGYIMELEVK